MRVSDYITEFSDIANNADLNVNIDDIIAICKRKNNSKRDFLFVNKLQGKHIPVRVEPVKSFLTLYAKVIEAELQRHWFKDVTVIGFAETATMLGESVADKLHCKFRQTTREDVFKRYCGYVTNDFTRINFAEEHSHAVAQYFYMLKNNDAISNSDAIVICEDEITTGKTIVNFVTKLKPYLKDNCRIYVMSVLNWQTQESLNTFKSLGVTPLYLAHGELPEGMHFEGTVDEVEASTDYIYDVEDRQNLFHLNNLQSLTSKVLYGTSYEGIEHEIQVALNTVNFINIVDLCKKKGAREICVLGTEEYMYPAFRLANKLCKDLNCRYDSVQHVDVKFHASTRSPITISENSPIYKGYKFHSTGDMEVTNYLYDFDESKYDMVVVVIGNDTDVDKMNTVDNLVPHDKLIYVCASKPL